MIYYSYCMVPEQLLFCWKSSTALIFQEISTHVIATCFIGSVVQFTRKFVNHCFSLVNCFFTSTHSVQASVVWDQFLPSANKINHSQFAFYQNFNIFLMMFALNLLIFLFLYPTRKNTKCTKNVGVIKYKQS
jgi:hypothetical protein